MVSSGLNLTGTVSLNASSAIAAADAVSKRLETVSTSARSSTTNIRGLSSAAKEAAAALKIQTDAAAQLAVAQGKVKESAAKAAATRQGAADASGIAATKKQIMLGESMEKITNANVIAQERLNNEELRGAEIAGRTTNGAAVAAGRIALTDAKAQTEAVRQLAIAEQSEGREALNNARIKATAAQTSIAAARLQMQQEAAASAAEARVANQQRESLAVTRGALGSLGASATHVGVVTGALFVGLAANAAVMQTQFTSVARTSDILDSSLKTLNAEGYKGTTLAQAQADAYAHLSLQFDALAQTLPISYKELTQIGAAANQLGVSHNNLAAFTQTVAQFSKVTGVSVDTASTAFGRLDSLIPDVQHNYQGLADAINKVGVDSVATDQQIINIASQIAGIAAAAGLGYKSIVGFSGALASVGISPYLARGLTTRLFSDITDAVDEGGSALTKYAITAGLSAKQFSDAWKKDPQTAVVDLLDGIHESGGNAVAVLKDLGINSVLDQPALIRLANAADKTGKSADAASRSGGILRQTLTDASSAAGENAKQFALVSDTVQSKLQVALNRAQIMFRDLGNSNLGVLGDAIDGISDDILKLTQGLDQPFKLFGALPQLFGLTNGAVIGFGVAALGVVSVLALLAGAGAKTVANLIALRQAFLGIKTYLGQTSAGMSIFGGAAAKAAVSNDVLAASIDRSTAAMARQAAASERSLVVPMGSAGKVNYQTGLSTSAASETQTITAANSMFNKASLAARAYQATLGRVVTSVQALPSAYTAAVGRMQASNNSVVRTLGTIGTAGTGAFSKVGSAASKVGSVVGKIGSGLAGFLGGPLGIATVAFTAVEGIQALENSMRQAGTTAGDASVAIVQMKSASQGLAAIKVDTNSFFGTLIGGPNLQSFVANTKEFSQGLTLLGNGGVLNDFVANIKSIGPAFAGSNVTFEQFTNGLDKLDAGFKKLSDQGNTNGAISGIQKLFKGMTDTQVQNALNHMPETLSILTEQLNKYGITAGKNNSNVIALAKNNKVLATVLEASASATDRVTGAYAASGDAAADAAQDASDYLNATKASAAAAIDLNKAYEGLGKDNSFSSFISAAKKQYSDFVNFQVNAVKIAHDTGMSLAEVSALDPGILSGAIKSGKKGEKELAQVMELKDAISAFQASIATLGADPQSKLTDAFTSLGTKAQAAIGKALGQGASIPDAFRAAGQKGVDAFNKTVTDPSQKITLHASLDVDARDLTNLSTSGVKALSAKIKIDGDPTPAIQKGEDAATAIANLKTYLKVNADAAAAVQKGETTAQAISRMQSTINILGDAAPAKAAGVSTQEYLGELEAKIILDANPAKAKRTAAQTQQEANALISRLTITGDGKSAIRTGKETSSDISKMVTSLVIDANGNLAKTKGKDTSSAISALKTIITILGDDVPAKKSSETAKQYIDRLEGTIAILGNPKDAKAQAAAAKKYADSLSGTIRVNANTIAAQDALAQLTKTRYATVYASVVGTGANAAQIAKNASLHPARGGAIYGPGTGTSDSIPAMLSNGEYVIRAAVASKFRGLLDNLNYRGIAAFASGGQVTGGSTQYNGTMAAYQSAAQATTQNNVTQITELSPYDRHLLQVIADNIGFSVTPEYLAGATSTVNRTQARRGNG